MTRVGRTMIVGIGITVLCSAFYGMFYLLSKEFRKFNVNNIHKIDKFNLLCAASPNSCQRSFGMAFSGFLGTVIITLIGLWAMAEGIDATLQCLLKYKPKDWHAQEQDRATVSFLNWSPRRASNKNTEDDYIDASTLLVSLKYSEPLDENGDPIYEKLSKPKDQEDTANINSLSL